VKVTMYGIPWILICMLGIIFNGLLYEKSTILKLNGASLGRE
jgi:hypothetical protein